MQRFFKALIPLVFLSSSTLLAQQNGLGNSPYSKFGVGELVPSGPTRNMGMGGVGVAIPAEKHINLMNPALLAYSRFASFDMAAYGQYKIVETENEWQTATGGTIHYGAFALPVHKRWSIGLSLLPFTDITYEKRYSGIVDGTEGNDSLTFFVRETGEGGLNKVVLGNGVKISERFLVGVDLAYFFGNKERLSEVALDIPGASVDGIQDQYRFQAFDVKFGAYYNLLLDSAKDLRVGVGATYNLSSELSTDFTQTRDVVLSSSGLTQEIDTFLGLNGTVLIPEQLKLGMSFYKPGYWSFSTEIAYAPWETFNFLGENPGFRDALTFRAGGEYVPNPLSVSSIFARTTYRLGAYYTENPMPVNDTFFEEIGINFGLSLPVTKFALVNLAVSVGEKGTTENGLVREQFSRFSLGLVINDGSWFRRYKLQ